jgi:hypothetical protein
MAEQPASDPVQPGYGRAAPGVEAMKPVERGCERLGAQVGRQLGVAGAAHEVAEQRPDVAPVEDRERLGLTVDGGEQLPVGPRVGHRSTLSVTPPPV